MHLESFETELNLRQSREGLPAAFKMRRERHYVEQLMGDAPLRTVREIPVSDIDPPEENPVDLAPLEQSIRDLGILQPLLVSKAGVGADVCSAEPVGAVRAHRWRQSLSRRRAARAPDGAMPGLRDRRPYRRGTAGGGDAQGARRIDCGRKRAASAPVQPRRLPCDSHDPTSRVRRAWHAGLREVTDRLSFVSAVMPALDVAGNDRLRWNVLTDVMKVEMERARSIAAAIEWLSQTSTAERELVDAGAIVGAAIEAVIPEARLGGSRSTSHPASTATRCRSIVRWWFGR